MRILLLTVVLFSSYMAQAQENLNDYKYIIVPKKFQDFKNENQHQTNTLVKYLLTKKGFATVWEDDLPVELAANRCLGLNAELADNSSMFTTKASVVLTDCNGKKVMETKEGKTKEKEYKAAYHEVIKEALTSLDGLNYAYSAKTEPSTISFKNDVKNVKNKEEETLTLNFKNDVKSLKEPKDVKQKIADNKPKPTVIQKATKEEQMYKDLAPEPAPVKKEVKTTVTQIATPEVQYYKDNAPKANTSNIKAKTGYGVLYAQEIANGFQLVDSTPKIQFKLKKTSAPDYYMATSDTTTGVVYAKNESWFFEYYQGEDLVTEELQIKF